MESPSEPKKQTWTHFGDSFLSKSYTQVPTGIYAVLDRMGFKMGRDRVVICLVKHLREGGTFNIPFTHKKLAIEANVSKRTVFSVLKTMEDNDAEILPPEEKDEFGRGSVINLLGFIARIAKVHKEMQKNDADFIKEQGINP